MFDYKIVPRDLPGAGPDERIVTGGTGRSHTILVGSSGRAWGAGRNVEGQCGVVSPSRNPLTPPRVVHRQETREPDEMGITVNEPYRTHQIHPDPGPVGTRPLLQDHRGMRPTSSPSSPPAHLP